MSKPRNVRVMKRLLAFAVSAVMVAALLPAAAFARTTTYVTVSACRAAEPVADILGADSVEGVNPFQNYDGNSSATGGAVKNNQYYLFANGLTAHNDVHKTNLLAYLAANGGTAPDLSTSATYSDTFVPGATLRNGAGGGPNKKFDVDSSYDYNYLTTMQPDVVVGDNGTTAGGTGTLTAGAWTAKTASWVTTSMDDILASTTAVASQIDATGKTTRYGSASTIATKLSNYVNGIRNCVTANLNANENPITKKKVAVITAATSNTNFTLGTAATVGTSTNRFVETLVGATVGDSDDLVTLDTTSTTIEDVYEYNDVVLVGGSQGTDSGMPDADGSELIDIVYQNSGYEDDIDTFVDMTYWTNTRSAGSLYGTVMNALDNAQNYGRILPFIYEDSIVNFTQDAAMTYWVREFYHVSGQNNITAAMATLYGTGMSSSQYVAANPTYADTVLFESLIAPSS